MKAETWLFALCSVFFVLVTPLYYWSSSDITGTTALVMTFLLTTLVAFYLGFHARKMEPRPEDRKDGEIAEGAGELGFFPPQSIWPLFCALTFGLFILGPVFGALLLTVLLNGLTTLGVSQYYQPLSVGVVVVAAAFLMRFQK